MVSLGAALAGSFLSVRRVVRLPPAEAMRPASPPSYRQGVLGGVLFAWLGPAARMVLREVTRRPVRTLLSALGIAAATGILVLAQFFSDAVGFLIDFYIQAAQRETLAVEFISPVPEASVRALRSYPGVRDVQWQAAMSVRVRAGHQSRIVPLVGHPARHSQRPLLDDDAREVALGASDVLFTDMLAKLLEIAPGDTVTVEPVTGERTPRRITMTGTIDELMGLWIHMPSQRMHALFRQAPYATTALLVVDRDQVEETQARIVDMPQVASVMRKDVLIREFRKQTGDTMGTFSFVLSVFAMGIAVSVVYNNARVALSLRSRELASLRVLGFTRREISSILIGELFVQVFLGVPLGLGFGKLLAVSMLAANDPEAFRFPSNLSAHTLAFAAAVTFGAALLSALAVRRKLDKLDLIGVLKTRE
jgi:putative ABC transport system permease protein